MADIYAHIFVTFKLVTLVEASRCLLCCVGGSLRPIDIQLMKNLQAKVNIVPIIAKADTLTSSEVKRLKAQVCITSTGEHT